MIELFTTYTKWKILSYFLANPNTSVHVKELSRILNVSSSSVSVATKAFAKEEFLTREEKGIACYYSLNSDNCLVSPLKMAYGLSFLLSSNPTKKFLDVDKNIISLAVFGSYANGSFDEKSDMDILIITPTNKEKLIDAAKRMEDELAKEVSLSVFKLSEWLLNAKKKDAFYKKIVENHILLYGSELK